MEAKQKLKYRILLVIKKVLVIRVLFVLIILYFFHSCKDGIKVKNDYYDNGTIKSEISYQDSTKHGEAKFYYPNGVLKEDYIFINDTIQGDYISYDENGLISSKGYFVNGKAIGPTYYYSQGRIILYNERTFQGGIYYVKKYDSLLHSLIKEEGVCIIQDTTAHSFLNLDSRNNFLFFYSQPNNCLNDIKIFIDDAPVKWDILKGHIGDIKIDYLKYKGKTLKIYSILKSAEDNIIICHDSLISIIPSYP